jgi:ribonuclease HI
MRRPSTQRGGLKRRRHRCARCRRQREARQLPTRLQRAQLLLPPGSHDDLRENQRRLSPSALHAVSSPSSELDSILDDEEVSQSLQDAWEHESSKDELKIELQGPERLYWLGTEAGRPGCYDFPGETWAGDGSTHKGRMGAGSVCFQQQGRHLEVRLGREAEGTTSLRPELAALARTLQATSDGTDLLYLCDSETTLDKVSRWIGRGPRTTLVGDANADIMKTIIECLRARALRGERTFMVKVKAHRGEPLNEKADTVAERARQLPVDSKQWTTRTPRLLYEWLDKVVKRVSTWSKAVRQTMLQGGAEFQRQRALARAASNRSKEILRTTDAGWARVQQAAGAGVKGDLMDRARWGWECMRRLQETEDRQTPGATTWRQTSSTGREQA